MTTTLNFNRVDVHEVPSNGSSSFDFDYGVTCANETSRTAYIGVVNPVKADVSVFVVPVVNANVSFVVARNLTRMQTNQGYASAWSGADYLRVIAQAPFDNFVVHFGNGQERCLDSQGFASIPSAVNLTVAASGKGDLNQDGLVDIFDIVIVALAFGTRPNDSKRNALADVNNDGIVDVFDVVVPAIGFVYYVQTVEFLRLTVDQAIGTNALGSAVQDWASHQKIQKLQNKYITKLKLP